MTAIQVIIMGNRRGLFSGGRYVQVTVKQRWPLSRFDCKYNNTQFTQNINGNDDPKRVRG